MTDANTTKPFTTSRLRAGREDDGERLDIVLARHVPGLSRRRARVLIAAGSVFLDGRRVLVHSRRVRAGAEVVCHDNPFATIHHEALEPSRVIFEDEDLLAIDKPAGVPSHPTLARRQGTALQLAEELLRRRDGRKVPLWPVHRLDAGTSGLLVFARSRGAARTLGDAFAGRAVEKQYAALVRGVPPESAGTIALPLKEGELASSVSADGKEARTRYRVVQTGPVLSLLELEPESGRMHQIRVHLAAIGHPVLGDTKYGPPEPSGRRLCLHACGLALPHPGSGRPLRLECPFPADWFELVTGRPLQEK